MAGLDPDDERYRKLREHVVIRCLPLAEHIAKRFSGRGEYYDDLVQVGRVGLVKAVDRFDVTVGSDFVAFAVPTITGEIRRHFRDTGWAVRVPRGVKELHLEIVHVTGALTQRHGRSPTAHELADELGVGEKDVVNGLLAGNAYQTLSVDAGTGDRRTDQVLADTLGEYDSELETVENHETLRPALAVLPERERQILALRFYGNLTQSKIAEQVGLSQMHVSRLLTRSLATLREELEP
ncbi:SigB/SigF/SigG family RNA polymerase sigma factor [Rhodococcus sp. ABRD24]|uniref:SigB/SigF/SigG family RNA polymerase sigma factor n=1 Tax=Rhodococcus sp. ABRD24 TaxID=2507582 RepID=UPI001F614F13|nr:SigB/SigF/SigG family RNA polymerase sigma factor [Rhodococcus sp. ABRD24]